MSSSHSSEHPSVDTGIQSQEVFPSTSDNLSEVSNTESERKVDIAIPLTQGKFTLVDKDDSELSEYSWYFSAHQGYAERKITKNGKRRHSFLHREIMEKILDRPLTRKDFVEHKNGNTLDNRRDNLLYLTASERRQRTRIGINNTSGYKGVYYNKNKKKYTSRITVQGREKSLGYYRTPEEAARMYNDAARLYYGEKAKLNDIPENTNN